MEVCLNIVFPAVPYCLELIGERRLVANHSSMLG